jgi:TonB family protein
MMVQAPKTTTPTPKRPKVEISKEIVVRTNRTVAAAQSTEKPRSRDTSVRETREREQRLAALANRINQSFSGSTRSLSDNLSSSTEIDFPGPGGAAYANWRQVVMSLYYNAWILPPSTPDSQQAVVRCEVTVARNGNITAQQILQPSRVPAVNRSVEEALDRVRLRGLPPFPAESKDLYRTFRINFNLETKRELG